MGTVVYKTQTLRIPINYFIVTMATSDLLYPILFIPLNLAEFLMDSWLIGGPLGQALCKLVPFRRKSSFRSEPGSDSSRQIWSRGISSSPIISLKLCPLFILTTWIVAMAAYSPYLFALKVIKYSGKLKCQVRWNDVFREFSFLSSYFVSSYVVFAGTMGACVITSLFILNQMNKNSL